jgi:hypothetical protein
LRRLGEAATACSACAGPCPSCAPTPESPLQRRFPLQWGRDTAALAQDILAAGIEAVLTCVDPKRLSPSFAGRRFDAQLLADLPPGVDPCGERGGCSLHAPTPTAPRARSLWPLSVVPPLPADTARPFALPPCYPPLPPAAGENGEFHTFVVSAPALFDRPIDVHERYDPRLRVERGGFVFFDVVPLDMDLDEAAAEADKARKEAAAADAAAAEAEAAAAAGGATPVCPPPQGGKQSALDRLHQRASASR